jgi:lipid II:glycine glycyltransferase (peptidoglycan interpeptide bridge formation enzyme)
VKAGLTSARSYKCYRTIVVDLSGTPEDIRKKLDKKWRNQLNGAEKNGLTFEVADSLNAYDEFLRLYDGMIARKQFETSVDVQQFRRIQETLPSDQKMQVFLAKKDGVVVASLVCSLLGDSAIYLLGATDEKARELKAAYYLHWQSMLWMKSRGIKGYDLGGIDPVSNPGGHHFKEGFGGADVTQLALYSRADGLLGRLAAMLSQRFKRG